MAHFGRGGPGLLGLRSLTLVWESLLQPHCFPYEFLYFPTDFCDKRVQSEMLLPESEDIADSDLELAV